MALKSCKDLIVWQKALELVVETYRASAKNCQQTKSTG
jgi:hypothetical protein